jgi:hypothetical protein
LEGNGCDLSLFQGKTEKNLGKVADNLVEIRTGHLLNINLELYLHTNMFRLLLGVEEVRTATYEN